MSSDEITWSILAHQHCAYKLSLRAHKSHAHQTFCRNEHNLTGFCSRQSCPLANSRYATVRSDPASNKLYLYLKTPERNHLPSQWWEKIALPTSYEKALAVIDEKLLYWPGERFLGHKCKQRLTRLTQVRIREGRLAREEERLGEKVVPRLASKVKRREETRERKAESSAKVERAIERELVERLRSGAYGTDKPVNVEEGVWRKVLRGLERQERVEKGIEMDEGEEEELDEDEEEREVEVEYVEDLEGSEAGEMEDFDDWLREEDDDSEDDDDTEESDPENGSEESSEQEEQADDKASGKRKRGVTTKTKPEKKSRKSSAPRQEIEYEYEYEEEPRLTESLLA